MDQNKNNIEKETDKDHLSVMEEAPIERRTAWSPRQLLIRVLWATFGKALWVSLPRSRPSILRLFGAKIGDGCTFARTVEVTIPWQLVMGNDCHVADHAIIYSLGIITIGDRVCIDTKAHLCAGTHDMRDSTFPLLRPPITIGDDCYIGVDAYIAPDVTVADRTIVYSRASVYRDTEIGSSLQGNPARAIE